MARRNAAVRTESEFLPTPSLGPGQPVRADDGTPPALGGARLAQATLAARLADEGLAAAAPRWSRRRGLVLAIGASATLWMAAALTVRLMLAR